MYSYPCRVTRHWRWPASTASGSSCGPSLQSFPPTSGWALPVAVAEQVSCSVEVAQPLLRYCARRGGEVWTSPRRQLVAAQPPASGSRPLSARSPHASACRAMVVSNASGSIRHNAAPWSGSCAGLWRKSLFCGPVLSSTTMMSPPLARPTRSVAPGRQVRLATTWPTQVVHSCASHRDRLRVSHN